MKYKCLLLDHDDTVVNSTASVNYVSFTKVLAKLRPEVSMTLEEFFKYNFDPGFMELCHDILKFTPEEMDYQVSFWKNYIYQHQPDIYKGLREILWSFVEQGGKIFVVSHSSEVAILRHYDFHKLPKPEHIYGWEYEEAKRKPSVWPVEDIIRTYGFKRDEIIMVDDLKPGKTMADKAGIHFAAAGWAHDIPEIVNYMRKESSIYCKTVEDLKKALF